LRNPVYGVTNASLMHPTNGVIMVSRLDGPTVEVALGLVDKAMQAESNGFWGRAYFDVRNTSEAGLKQGDEWIRSAAEVCRLLGFETEVDESPSTFSRGFPMSQIAVYAGWYRGDVDGPFLEKEVEFMPGALAYHLHSFSAASLRTVDRSWVGPLLARGATVSLGSVHEPYLGGTPDIGTLVGRFYYFGFTYGEAAYAGQSVASWMTTVVGDPLFKPFLRNPQELHEELVARRDPLRAWSQLRIVNLSLAKGLPKYQAVTYLEEIPATKESAVLSEKLGDLYSELGKPASALRSWQLALERNPSRQQKIRLQLRLGEKLAEAGKIPEAKSVYERFVEQNPDHPDVVTVYWKLIPLANELGMTNQAARFREAIARSTPTNAP
jgi:tetratricopeptide (TPR) repeat protein